METIKEGPEDAENVLFLVTKRVQYLSPDVRRILKLAACLGYAVSKELLGLLDRRERLWQRAQRRKPDETDPGSAHEELESSMSSLYDIASPHEATDRSRFENALLRAVAEGLIECHEGICRFSHDRVQQCVYEFCQTPEFIPSRYH